MPAILKGWIDRVFVLGDVYTSKMRYDRGSFAGRRALLSVTCGGPGGSYQEDGRNGDIDLFLWPTNYTLNYMGYTILPHFAATGLATAAFGGAATLASHLADCEDRYRQHLLTPDSRAPIEFNKWGDWDDEHRFKKDVRVCNSFSRARRETPPKV